MKLSLRKANAIQVLLAEQLAIQNLNPTVAIGKYEKASEVLERGLTKFHSTLNVKLHLLKVYYSIRKKVSAAGEAAGVSALLADLAWATKTEILLKTLAQSPAKEDVLVVDKKVAELYQATANHYQSKDSLTTGVLPADVVAAFSRDVAAVRKQKQKFSDKLLELNIKTEIELSEEEEVFLKNLDLI